MAESGIVVRSITVVSQSTVLSLSDAEAQKLAELLGFVALSQVPELDSIADALEHAGFTYPESDDATLTYLWPGGDSNDPDIGAVSAEQAL